MKALLKRVSKMADLKASTQVSDTKRPFTGNKTADVSRGALLGPTKGTAHGTTHNATVKDEAKDLQIARLQLSDEQKAKKIALLELNLEEMRLENKRVTALLEKQEEKYRQTTAAFDHKIQAAVKASGNLNEQMEAQNQLADRMARKYQKKKGKCAQLKSALKLTRGELEAAKETVGLLKTQLGDANRKQLVGLEELQAECSEIGALRTRV